MNIAEKQQHVRDLHLSLLSEGFCWICKEHLIQDGEWAVCKRHDRRYQIRGDTVTELIPLPQEARDRAKMTRWALERQGALTVRFINGDCATFHALSQVPSEVTHIGLNFHVPSLEPIYGPMQQFPEFSARYLGPLQRERIEPWP